MKLHDTSCHSYYGGKLLIGVMFVCVGTLFLLNNFGLHMEFMSYRNWWALFILAAAAGPLGYAIQRYRQQGRLDGAILHSLISTAAIVTVSLVFLLDLSWDRWWPVFIIISGLWMMTGYRKGGSRIN